MRRTRTHNARRWQARRTIRITILILIAFILIPPVATGMISLLSRYDATPDDLPGLSMNAIAGGIAGGDLIVHKGNMSAKTYNINSGYTFHAKNLNATYPGCSYYWYFGDDTPIRRGISVVHEFPDEGRYTITCWLTAANGTMMLQDSVTITVQMDLISLIADACIAMFIVCPLACFVGIVILISIALAAIINRVSADSSGKGMPAAKVPPAPKKKFRWQTVSLWITLFLTINGFFMASIGLALITDDFTDICLPSLLFPFNLCIGVMGWIVMAFLGIGLWRLFLSLARNAPYFKKFRNNFILIRKDDPIVAKYKKGKKKIKWSSHINFALEAALTGSFVSFFLITLAFHGVDSLDELTDMAVRNSWLVRLLILYPPIISMFIIPFQVLLDSNLLFVNRDKKRGIVVVYLGSRFKDILQGVLGVSAVMGFIMLFLTLNDSLPIKIMACIGFMFTVFTLTFPVVFWVSLIYSFMHNWMVRRLNTRWDTMGIREFHIRESKQYENHLCIEPLEVKRRREADPDFRPFGDEEVFSTSLVPGPPQAPATPPTTSPPPPTKNPPGADRMQQ